MTPSTRTHVDAGSVQSLEREQSRLQTNDCALVNSPVQLRPGLQLSCPAPGNPPAVRIHGIFSATVPVSATQSKCSLMPSTAITCAHFGVAGFVQFCAIGSHALRHSVSQVTVEPQVVMNSWPSAQAHSPTKCDGSSSHPKVPAVGAHHHAVPQLLVQD
jgi:hypothetical protein